MGVRRRVFVGAIGLAVVALGGCDAGPTDAGPADDASTDAPQVRLIGCAPSADSSRGPTAQLEVVNRGSQSANYQITVAFNTEDGSTEMSSANATVLDLAPGKT